MKLKSWLMFVCLVATPALAGPFGTTPSLPGGVRPLPGMPIPGSPSLPGRPSVAACEMKCWPVRVCDFDSNGKPINCQNITRCEDTGCPPPPPGLGRPIGNPRPWGP